LIDYLKF
jgi:hypothetical protein